MRRVRVGFGVFVGAFALLLALTIAKLQRESTRLLCDEACVRALPKSNLAIGIVLGIGPSYASPILDRADLGASLFRAGAVRRIIVSGGKGSDERESEAATLKQALARAGVPPEVIVEEDQSRSTVENLVNVRAILETRGWREAPLYIVTHVFHAPRVQEIATSLGLRARVVATEGARLRHRQLHWVREALSYWKWRLTKVGRT